MGKQNPPSKQHYLPAVYLKQFSVDGPKATRESHVWLLNGRINKQVPVESQCFERFFNSRANPEGAERIFQDYEEMYGRLAVQIWEGRECKNLSEYFGLLVFMISLHFRNPSYTNLTKDERIAVYWNLEKEFIHNFLVPDCTPESSMEEQARHLKQTWRVRVLLTAENHELVTSDNPVQIFETDQSGIPRLMVMPITPYACAMAFDHRWVQVRGSVLTLRDEGHLNKLQALSCLKALYSKQQIARESEEWTRDYWKRRKPPSGFIDEEEWRPNFLRLVEPFDFLSLLSPSRAQ